MLINPLLIKIGLVLASIIAAFFMGYRSASIAVHGQWDKEKAQNNAQVAQLVADTNAKVLKAEHQASLRIAAIGAIYENKLKETKNAQNSLDAVNTSSGLFVNAELPNYCHTTNNTTTATGHSHGSKRVRLSEQDGRFLIQFAADADQIVNQLTQCQSIILSDRINHGE